MSTDKEAVDKAFADGRLPKYVMRYIQRLEKTVSKLESAERRGIIEPRPVLDPDAAVDYYIAGSIDMERMGLPVGHRYSVSQERTCVGLRAEPGFGSRGDLGDRFSSSMILSTTAISGLVVIPHASNMVLVAIPR